MTADHYEVKQRVSQLVGQFPIPRLVSMGPRNARTESQVQEFQGLKIIRGHKSEETASCLRKTELQPQRIGPLETYRQIK
jgi:hypothetical protein